MQSLFKVLRVPAILASHGEGHKVGMIVNRAYSKVKLDVLKSKA